MTTRMTRHSRLAISRMDAVARARPRETAEHRPRANRHSSGEQHYRCVQRWLEARRAQKKDDELAQRKALQAGHLPLLFALFEERRRLERQLVFFWVCFFLVYHWECSVVMGCSFG